MTDSKYPDTSGGWNYRMIIKEHGTETYSEIHEVYYNDKNQPVSWTKDPVYPSGSETDSKSSTEELKRDIEYMLKACEKEPLYLKELEEKVW